MRGEQPPGERVNDATAVVALANERHGTAWSLVGPLPGGYQQGAFELRSPQGERAVLKWHRRHLPMTRLAQTAVVIDAARRRGWPTARWLAYGALPHDAAYIVEEFIAGTTLRTLDDPAVDEILRMNRLQANLGQPTEYDWSAYLKRVVFEDEGGQATRLRTHPDTERVARWIEATCAQAKDVVLPTTDLVHGDFVTANMLVRDNVMYVIDAAHAASGTRAYDLATLFMDSTIHDLWEGVSLARRVETECVSLVGRDGLLVCVAARTILLLAFGLQQWRPESIPIEAAQCERLLERARVG